MVKLLGKSGGWKFRSIQQGYEREGALVAVWKVALDSIGDEYNSKTVTAAKLFDKWVAEAAKEYQDGLVPIQWFVECKAHGITEYMPFQFNHMEGKPPKDFLSIFTWPESSSSGERLDWLKLPVAEKHWNPKQMEKGGFIQEATGWKPGILQPYVYLPALLHTKEEF